MKILLPAAAVALTLFFGSVRAQTPCQDFEAAIEYSLKNISVARVEGIGDDSAPRATLRAIEANNQLLLIQIQLGLMNLNKCPVRKTSLSATKYVDDALACSAAMRTTESDPPACDRSKWAGFKK